jgi:hypothetical protein
MKKIALLAALVVCAQAIFAQANDSGVTFPNSIDLQISTLPEAKVGFTQHFKFPFLQGDGPLTKGNNIDLSLRGEVSPV